MELKENVIYVTPDGNAFKGSVFNKLVDKVSDAWENIKAIIQKAASTLLDAVKKLLGIVDESKTNCQKRNRRSWKTPWNTTRKSQVMNRRPVFVQIRNHI